MSQGSEIPLSVEIRQQARDLNILCEQCGEQEPRRIIDERYLCFRCAAAARRQDAGS